MTPTPLPPIPHWALRVVAVLALAGSAVFGLWPLHAEPSETPSVNAPIRERTPIPALDLAAFRIPLWVAEPPPPPPPAPPGPPTPPPPLKIQLLAILKEGDLYKAAVYDPDADKILVLAAGETIGSRTVSAVTRSGITIKDAQGVRTLALKGDAGGGSP